MVSLVACASFILAQPQPPLGARAQLADRRLRELKGGLLVVVDGPKGEWKAKVEALRSDPDWLDLDLPTSYYASAAHEMELLLRQKYQTGPRPQWVLFGEGGRVVASGGTVPEPKVLVQAAEQGGVRSELQLMREFSRRHPDHLEARENLCRMLRVKASQRTLARLGKKAEPLRPADESFDFMKYRKEQDAKEEAKAQEPQDEKPAPLLAAQEDQAIWGELAELMGKAFRSGDWIEVESWGLTPDETAVHSPLMLEACRGAVPEVERALGRNPSSWNLWRLWLGLTNTFGGKPLRPLLDSLTPLPTLASSAWPPYSVQQAFVKDARKRKDWAGIKDLLLPQIESARLWEAVQGRTTFLMKMDGKVQEEPETGEYWRSVLEPLVEALIRLGDTGQADELVRERFTKHPWASLPKQAAALALRCNQPNLAAQWGALGSGN